jgi:hypothetical protein
VIRRVHQVVFSHAGAVELKGYARTATRSVKFIYVDHEYRIWYLADARAFIGEHFPKEILWAFDTLVPYAFKADLFKLCLLKVLGGWVVDVGVRMLRSPVVTPIVEQDPDFVLFRSTGAWDPPWNCSVAFAYAKPGHRAFDTALGWIVDHCRTRYYGHTPLMPTMSTFGRALAHHQVHENTCIGTVVDVARWRPYRRAFQLPPLGLVAARKPPSAAAGDISSIGVSGTNNYAQLWRAKQVYGEAAD